MDENKYRQLHKLLQEPQKFEEIDTRISIKTTTADEILDTTLNVLRDTKKSIDTLSSHELLRSTETLRINAQQYFIKNAVVSSSQNPSWNRFYDALQLCGERIDK